MAYSGRRSPFPGMDPFLESRWSDVHASLCIEIRTALQPQLPAGLRARAEENIFFETLPLPTGKRWYRGDVTIAQGLRGQASDVDGPTVAVLADPIRIRIVEQEIREKWVEIIDTAHGGRLVTVIEVLSPSNKSPGKANEKYKLKQKGYQDSGVNIVELDLLRSSREHLVITHDQVQSNQRVDYLSCINRSMDFELWNVYPMSLREPLPNLPIPCRPGDIEPILKLQSLISKIYHDGAHDDIDYNASLEPPLLPDDQAWVSDLLKINRLTAD